MLPDQSNFLRTTKLMSHKSWRMQETYPLLIGANRFTSVQIDLLKRLVEVVKRKRDTETDKVHVMHSKIVSYSKNFKPDSSDAEEIPTFYSYTYTPQILFMSYFRGSIFCQHSLPCHIVFWIPVSFINRSIFFLVIYSHCCSRKFETFLTENFSIHCSEVWTFNLSALNVRVDNTLH